MSTITQDSRTSQTQIGSIGASLSLAFRLLRDGVSGFRIFVACLALGVAVITGVGALSDSLKSGLEQQGRQILGGDVLLSRVHTRATLEERKALASFANVSETASMRAMATRFDGSEPMLIELKGVDKHYPMVGDLKLGGDAKVSQLQQPDTAAVDPILLERLNLNTGDTIRVGKTNLTITTVVKSEPDALSNRLTYGPRVLISSNTLANTGLIQPGTLIRWRYSLQLPEEKSSEKDLDDLRTNLKQKLSDHGFTIADRRNPSPQIKRVLERLRQFLTLIGLSALLIGGVGVANAVATFIDRQRKTIATFKSLGATSHQIFSIYIVQILVMATIGIGLGLVLGATIPFVLSAIYGDALPLAVNVTISAASIAMAIAYGYAVALLFSLWPLGRAELVPAAVLFRDNVSQQHTWPRWPFIAATLVLAFGLGLLAILTSEPRTLALYMCAAITGFFLVFIALGETITRLARRWPKPRQPELALAIGNLGAPGGLTRSVVLSLGAGLSVLVAIALADVSFERELETGLPENSPDYFVLDIPKIEADKFHKLVSGRFDEAVIKQAPMLRGRLVSLKGVPVEQVKAPAEARWVLSGDRGITYAEKVPDGSKVTAGKWWPADYTSEPLVSFEADLAKQLGLGLGDKVTVNVLGRDLTAKISNLRKVEWENLAINFVMVFSPNSLAGAPANALATITLPDATTLKKEADLLRDMTKTFPAITAIRVKDAIGAFNTIFAKVMTAVRAAAIVALLAGALVLAGALATAQRRRILTSVILSAIGASRARILRAHITEYILLSLVTSCFAIILGAGAAWVVLTQVMEVAFTFSWAAVALALTTAIGLVVIMGGLGTWAVLQVRPVPVLRSES